MPESDLKILRIKTFWLYLFTWHQFLYYFVKGTSSNFLFCDCNRFNFEPISINDFHLLMRTHGALTIANSLLEDFPVLQLVFEKNQAENALVTTLHRLCDPTPTDNENSMSSQGVILLLSKIDKPLLLCVLTKFISQIVSTNLVATYAAN